MTSVDKLTILKNKKAVSFRLDFLGSPISFIYAVCLANVLRKQKECHVDLQVPQYRHKPHIGEAKGTDSNAFPRRGSFAIANYSAKGTRIDGWILEQRASRSSDSRPHKGTLKKCLVPPPEERIYFPNIITEDKL
ncbi:hypothetical protein SVAN01_00843 [Stagonosporopsis vannaccii]|nr:hypothetical protein SVAN01_00843 [Stagonosporopsis vannaccii]